MTDGGSIVVDVWLRLAFAMSVSMVLTPKSDITSSECVDLIPGLTVDESAGSKTDGGKAPSRRCTEIVG